METAMGVKYRPVVLCNGGAAAKRMRPAEGGVYVYRECLKNHAASLGGNAVDGCGEFMPSPAANPSNPTSLTCAACGCHRNFHRRLQGAPPSPPLLALPPVPSHPAAGAAPTPPRLMQAVQPQRGEETPENRLPVPGDEYSEDTDDESDYDDDDDDDDDRPASPLAAPADIPPPGYLSATHMLLSLSTGAPGSSPAVMASRPPAPAPALLDAEAAAAAAARKRIRTKFSPEQKQQMQALSERLGWRLQKSDQAMVQECCRKIGVGKGVFKVWMHNNKHNFVGGRSARRSASLAAGTPHPSTYATPPPAPAIISAPPIHAGFNINGSSTFAALDHSRIQPATASTGSGSPRSS